MVSRLVNMTNTNLDSIRVGRQTWGEQFRNALNVNGGDLESATNMDYVMHFLTFAWKVSPYHVVIYIKDLPLALSQRSYFPCKCSSKQRLGLMQFPLCLTHRLCVKESTECSKLTLQSNTLVCLVSPHYHTIDQTTLAHSKPKGTV